MIRYLGIAAWMVIFPPIGILLLVLLPAKRLSEVSPDAAGPGAATNTPPAPRDTLPARRGDWSKMEAYDGVRL